MPGEIATHEDDHRRWWLTLVVFGPLLAGAVALLGGRFGRSIVLAAVGAVAIGSLVVARRRRAQGPPSAHQVPPAELMAFAVVAFIAAEAFGVGGVTEGRGAIGDWTAVAAVLAALVAVWAFL